MVHVMEGEVSNARYWYGEAKREFPREPSLAEEIDSLDAALNA